MKKKSFLSGIGAKLALAAVALTTVVFTSCEEEKFNVEPTVPVELAPASATIMVTVYDQTTGAILMTATPTTINAEADGNVKAQSVPVSCPFSDPEYLPVEGTTVNVPAVKKGQMVLIPVTFYALKITSAAQNVTVSKEEDSVTEVSSVATAATEGVEGTGVPQEVEVEAYTGTKVMNKTAIYANIENLVNSRAAISNENVVKVLKSLVDSYDNQRTVTKTVTVTIPAGAIVNLKPVTEMTEYVIDIKATVDGVEYPIEGVKIKEAGNTIVTMETVSHGHGHGDSGNAGGGAGGK